MKHMYGINLVFDIGSSTIFQGIFLSFFLYPITFKDTYLVVKYP